MFSRTKNLSSFQSTLLSTLITAALLVATSAPSYAQTTPPAASTAAMATEVGAPTIAGRAYLLVDVQTGATLAQQNAEDRVEPASLTKLMTAYLVFEALRDKALTLEQTVPVSVKAWKAIGSRMFIDPKQTPSVQLLIRGMIIQSGNDASIALAEAIAGTEERFVQLMNTKAKKLGLKSTNFMNATGLPDAQHYSTARDLALLATTLIQDFPTEFSYYKEKEFTHNNTTQQNRNRLLWLDPSVDGMKTGFTDSAGYCLIATAKRGEGDKQRRLLSVVLGTASDTARAQESQKLLNYGFQYFDSQRLYKKGEAIATPEIYKGTQKTIRLGFNKDVWVTLPRDKFQGLAATLNTTQPLLAPLALGQQAGIMKLSKANAVLLEIPVVALDDVPTAGFLSRGWDSIRLLLK
jgi:serine-type D-Ala-D-Ala carboxypeptidase (penicillin-binding protein 5/6)